MWALRVCAASATDNAETIAGVQDALRTALRRPRRRRPRPAQARRRVRRRRPPPAAHRGQQGQRQGASFPRPPHESTHHPHSQLQTQVQLLQAQLAQRPPAERIQELEKEYKNLDLLLQGTQRENERCMFELDRSVLQLSTDTKADHPSRRAKLREKLLEQALAKVAGENWQVRSPDNPPHNDQLPSLSRLSTSNRLPWYPGQGTEGSTASTTSPHLESPLQQVPLLPPPLLNHHHSTVNKPSPTSNKSGYWSSGWNKGCKHEKTS
jgi:hypothetical protein